MDFRKLQKFVFLSIALTQIAPSLSNQTLQSLSGIPYIQNFTPEEYHANFQNLDIIQGKDGLIYAANAIGVLEYDGSSWRLMRTPKSAFALSLASDSIGAIYVGAFQDLGYLAPDSTATFRFVSLLGHVDSSYHDFTSIWKTHSTPEGVFYNAGKYLFRWANNRMKVWRAETAFQFSFFIRNELLIFQKDKGLMHIDGDSLRQYPGGEKLAGHRIFAMAPWVDGKLLIGTFNKGLFIFDRENVHPFADDIRDYLAASLLTDCVELPGGHYAFSSRKNGLLIIDSSGSLVRILGKSEGLQDQNINGLTLDRQGGLWLAMETGISRIEPNSPVTIFDERMGLPGKTFTTALHNERLYAGTNEGVFVYSPERNSFRRVKGIDGNCWALLSTGRRLLAGADVGLYLIDEPGLTAKPISEHRTRALVSNHHDDELIYVGHDAGLSSLRQTGGKWKLEDELVGQIRDLVYTMKVDAQGNLWVGTLYNGVYLYRPGKKSVVEHFGVDEGLPGLFNNRIALIDGKPVICTAKGIFQFQPASKTFSRDHRFGEAFADTSRGISAIAGDGKRLWISSGVGASQEICRAMPNTSGGYDVDFTPFRRFRGAAIFSLHAGEFDKAWFASARGLIQFDERMIQDHPTFPALIREVRTGRDSVIFGGDAATSMNITLPYRNNSLRFTFSAPSYDDVKANHYRYRLEGYDKDFSNWSEERRKDYTNLPEGRYRFRVQAQNIYQISGREADFAFEILPPWYRTWWAYGVYAVFVCLGFAGGIRWRSAKLEREKAALQELVDSRTAEVAAKNRQLAAQTDKLKEVDKLKSRFFANISHEFRTPLTLIIDPLDEIITGSFKGNLKKRAEVMRRNGWRLLRLINQLLDLSKLESGNMALHASKSRIIPFLKAIGSSFESQAAIREIKLGFHVSEAAEDVELYFDSEKMEQIITNLLSNAFKYTPPGGEIVIQVSQRSDVLRATATNSIVDCVEIVIRDTGTGIPDDRLPYIFDRFYQVDSSQTRAQEGTGIGLALTKELVELHKGKIDVTSKLDQETVFTLRFPLGRNHLTDEQIVKSESEPIVSTMAAEQFDLGEPAVEHEASNDNTVVLVVEDSADVRNYIKDHLTPDFNVLLAENGARGAEIALEMIPDLIISDVMMPKMDGIELCQKLKQDIKTSHIPIILLTARASQEHKIEGLETGADDYLIKPFNSKELRVRINNLIQIRHKLQEKYRREYLLEPKQVTVVSMDDEFLHQARQVVEEHISDTEFSVKELSKSVAMSRGHLHRKLRALTGQSVQQFIRAVRLKRAAQLLRQRAGNITEIAFEVGFPSSAYFTKCFKEQFGTLPRDFAEDSP